MRNVGHRVPAGLLVPREMRPDELPDIRRLWWRQRRHDGVELPSERGVILFEGGKR